VRPDRLIDPDRVARAYGWQCGLLVRLVRNGRIVDDVAHPLIGHCHAERRRAKIRQYHGPFGERPKDVTIHVTPDPAVAFP
jgi:hypothetical protein